MCRLMVALQPTAQNIGPMGDFRPGRLALPDRRRVFHEQRKSRSLETDRTVLQGRPCSQMGRRRYFDQAVELDQMSGELPTLELMVCPSFPCVLRDRQNRFESCSRFQRVLSALAVPRPYPAKTYEHSARAKSSGACHGGTYGWFFGVPRKGLRLRERDRAQFHRKIGRDQAVERVVGNRRIVRRGLGSCGIREGDLTHSWAQCP
jgi:hypothetical protein